jgi:A/G-specific adenine glycosylase
MDNLLSEWFGENRRLLPWWNTTNPYEILVSEVMAQQSRLENVELLPRQTDLSAR